jgi:hypothetical protein
MKPYPLQYVEKDAEDTLEFKNAYQKLVRYYARLGFTKIPSQLGNGFRSGPLSPSAGTPSAFLGHQAILGQAKIARPRTKRGRLR